MNYAILGPNGSGKSTLLQLISGAMLPSEGSIQYLKNGNVIEAENVYKDLVYAAPYISVFEQFTMAEVLNVHRNFKQFYSNMSNEEIAERIFLNGQLDVNVEVFSSGMKQRLKLALAIFSQSELLLLDEPLSNLDEKGRDWYKSAIDEFHGNRTVVVCSNNQKEEFSFCDHVYELAQFTGK